MALDQHASNLIDLTVKTFNGDVTNVSPMDGMSLLDSWISFLHTDQQGGSRSIETELTSLKAIIQEGGTIDAAEISGLLTNLTNQTKQISEAAETENKPKLNALVTALQSFGHLVEGSGGPAKTGGQAPMTSTVGGESTTSGAGISAMADTDDDALADRNGGTVDEDPTIDMDDTTGSDGGAPEADAPAKSSDAQTGDSSYSSGSTASRSDTSRIDGSGLSGGTGDTDTAQSGGRSQY